MAAQVTKESLESTVVDFEALITKRLADAEKDRLFVEAVRNAFDAHPSKNGAITMGGVDSIIIAHRDIYGRPCTAEKEGK